MSTRSLFVALVGVVALGCSVDGVDGLFGQGDDGEGQSGGGQGQGGAPTTKSTTTGNPDGGNTTTLNPDTTTDTGAPGPMTATDATTTGPDPGGSHVFCNNLPCSPGDVCCYYQFAVGKDFCAASAEECPDFEGWVELECNGPDDCPGQECCATWTRQNGWGGSECASNCNGGNQYELCANPSGMPDLLACDVASVCKASMSLGAGYAFCDDTP